MQSIAVITAFIAITVRITTLRALLFMITSSKNINKERINPTANGFKADLASLMLIGAIFLRVSNFAKRNKMYLPFIHLQNTELAYFLVVLFLKAFFRIFLLDINYLKSYYLFLTSINKCRTAKAAIAALQKKKNISITVRNVVDEIKRNIPKKGIEKF